MVRTSPDDAPSLVDQGSPESLRRALNESLVWLASQPAEREFIFGPRRVSAAEQREALAEVVEWLGEDLSPAELAARMGARFDVFESVGGAMGDVLVTGYYEPRIEASLTPDPDYPIPIYGLPDDRVEIALGDFSDKLKGEKIVARREGEALVPYHDRAAIRAGALARRKLEIGWARDEVDLFFLEVQGSGTLALPDGGERRIGYAANNGRVYKSVGKLLIDDGLVAKERMSMQAIRSYLAAHPGDLRRVLDYNPSFVFFRFLVGGAEGSLGRPVTAGRSIATDRKIFPHGALCFLDTTLPEARADGGIGRGGAIGRFVLNQDTGGAIRGPDRADLYFGPGRAAAAMAGRMRQRGRLYFLAPKGG